MSDIGGNAARRPFVEPDLLTSQKEIVAVNREMMAGAYFSLATVEFTVPGVSPMQARESLRAVMPDMFVADGGRLLPTPGLHIPDASEFPDVRPGLNTDIHNLTVSTWGVQDEKRRFVDASREGEFANQGLRILNLGDTVRIEWPGEYEWRAHVSTTFWYKRGDVHLGELVRITTNHREPGTPPTLESRVALGTTESCYSYSRFERPARDELEALYFLTLIRQMHERCRRGQ